MMKLKSEDRVKILEYKFVFEEEKQIDREYQEGSADLNYRLSFFRNKLDNTLPNHIQQSNRYDDMFMGGRKTDVLHEIEKIKKSKNIPNATSANKSNQVKPWAKKIYKKIVLITHPNKPIRIQSTKIKKQ